MRQLLLVVSVIVVAATVSSLLVVARGGSPAADDEAHGTSTVAAAGHRSDNAASADELHPHDHAHAAGESHSHCTCDEARLRDGWCREHRLGHVAGTAVPSALLFEVLDAHGHVIDPPSIECQGCQAALLDDGFCDRCVFGFIDDQLYSSRLTWALARGQRRDPAGVTCPVCREHGRGYGWCERCGVGTVGVVAFDHQSDYDSAAEQIEVLRAALDMLDRGEMCAVTTFTGATCPTCEINHGTDRRRPAPGT